MKRLLSLLLTCAFLLGALTACGGGKTEPQTASSSEPASASTAAASAEPASAAAEPTEAELELFTASENFPYPYSEELERDKTTGQYLLTLEQALYDYDTCGCSYGTILPIWMPPARLTVWTGSSSGRMAGTDWSVRLSTERSRPGNS